MRKENITMRAFWTYSAYNPKYFPLKFLHILFQSISPYFNLWMSAEIVTALYAGKDKQAIFLLVAITLLSNLLVRIVGALLGNVTERQHEILANNEAAAFNNKTLSLDYDKLENPEIRQLRRKISQNSQVNSHGMRQLRFTVEKLMDCAVQISLSCILFAEMLGNMASVRFPLMGAVLLVLLFIFVVLTIVMQSRGSKKNAANWNSLSEYMLRENRIGQGYKVSGMDCRIYRQQQIITPLEEKNSRDHLRVFTTVNRKSFLYETPVFVLTKLSETCTYLLVCLYCTLGAFPVGSVIKYVGYLGRLIKNICSLFNQWGRAKHNEPFLKQYLDYFDIQNDMYQGSLAVEKRSDKKFDIEFKNVSFRYAGADTYALKNINLHLKVGERLAVVGMNGSGKTTFIKLLCRLYDPTEGEILMNDFNIRKYDYRQYLDIFSVVFQDYSLLGLPLGNNVASAERWDTEKAESCLEEVGFGERYREMPQKLDTPLYKNFDADGVNLSGGEAQKVALARALYKDAPFIILDEPTAALDPIAEAEIYAKFNDIVGDKTAIYISHRLSSCRFCDKIAVFDRGSIVQVGTHDELVADERGKYYELWNAQAQYYTEKK